MFKAVILTGKNVSINGGTFTFAGPTEVGKYTLKDIKVSGTCKASADPQKPAPICNYTTSLEICCEDKDGKEQCVDGSFQNLNKQGPNTKLEGTVDGEFKVTLTASAFTTSNPDLDVAITSINPVDPKKGICGGGQLFMNTICQIQTIQQLLCLT